MSVTVSVDAGICEGHGLCEAVAPRLFEMGDDDRAHVIDVAVVGDLVGMAHEAARVCPCQAISVRGEPAPADGG